jgi:hypothetical protein
MTIYILDQDFQESAQMLDDFNLQEVIKEIASILCNVNPYFKLSTTWPRVPDKPPEEYNEWEKWASQSRDNYTTLLEYGNELLTEHRYRFYQPCRCNMECNYDKPYGQYDIEECIDHLPDLPKVNSDIPWHETIPIVLSEGYGIFQFKLTSTSVGYFEIIESYKNDYFRIINKENEKISESIYKWTKRERPILSLR